MSNDITRILVEFDEGEKELVSLNGLNLLTTAMGSLANALCVQLFQSEMTPAFLFVAPPQRGSIDFRFKVEFSVRKPPVPLGRGDGPKDFLTKAAAVAGIGAFVWQVAFGGQSLALLLGGSRSVPPLAPTEAAHVKAAIQAMSYKAVSDEVRRIKLAASETGGARVYIQTDEEPVLIWSREQRLSSRLLSTRRKDGEPDAGPQTSVSLQGPFLKVEFAGREYEAVRGTVTVHTGKNAWQTHAIVLWGSTAPRPLTQAEFAERRKIGPIDGLGFQPVEVRGRFLRDGEEVYPLAGVPPEFEESPVYLVEKLVEVR